MTSQLLEAVLFAAAEPVARAELLGLAESEEELNEALVDLERSLADRGLQLMSHSGKYELVTRAEFGDALAAFHERELKAELSKPASETLALLAYRGPLTRPEIELIRGVNSALMLRNLLMRGLVEELSKDRLGQPLYDITAEFLRGLGVSKREDLPGFESLATDERIARVLAGEEPEQK